MMGLLIGALLACPTACGSCGSLAVYERAPCAVCGAAQPGGAR
mgnify:CR=1 FL=1